MVAFNVWALKYGGVFQGVPFPLKYGGVSGFPCFWSANHRFELSNHLFYCKKGAIDYTIKEGGNTCTTLDQITPPQDLEVRGKMFGLIVSWVVLALT